jgi:hypothetical protein
MEERGELHTPLRPRYRLDRRLGGRQCQPGSCGERKSLASSKKRIPIPWSSNPESSIFTDRAVSSPCPFLSRDSTGQRNFIEQSVPQPRFQPGNCTAQVARVTACCNLFVSVTSWGRNQFYMSLHLICILQWNSRTWFTTCYLWWVIQRTIKMTMRYTSWGHLVARMFWRYEQWLRESQRVSAWGVWLVVRGILLEAERKREISVVGGIDQSSVRRVIEGTQTLYKSLVPLSKALQYLFWK